MVFWGKDIFSKYEMDPEVDYHITLGLCLIQVTRDWMVVIDFRV